MPDRKLTFVGAGDSDVSEVNISTGTHLVAPAPPTARVTYTVSYPGGPPGGDPKMVLAARFAEAAVTIIEDADQRGVQPGEP
jgi:hypothetical protein